MRGKRALSRVEEEAAVRQARAIGGIDYIFFRRFDDGRSSQVAAYVIDNDRSRLAEDKLAEIHWQLWLHGSAPLLYVGWRTRVDVLSCARGPDFWENGARCYRPAASVETAAEISDALACERFSAQRLGNGTFWEDPANAGLAHADKAAHRRLIEAVVETDAALGGDKNAVLRRLLLLTVLIKYLEDREVFPKGWFGRFSKGSDSFFAVLRGGNPDDVRALLQSLERKFNGDVFTLPETHENQLTHRALGEFARLVGKRTLQDQLYLWDQYSFRHIPVEVLSHLYQRFAQPDKGAVFTPPFVASLMLDHALPYDRLTGREKVLDPTCGSGVFLVGAFRRLVHHWRSSHNWKRPSVQTLKDILKRSIFGVELQTEAVQLAAFSLALAVCDALQPEVIWSELRFDRLVGLNLLAGDFFERLPEVHSLAGKERFSTIVGNPPFLSHLTASAEANVSEELVPVPDKQMGYAVAWRAMTLLRSGGRMCLIQHHGFLYNANVRDFRREFFTRHRVDAVLDFTSIRNLYDGADPKTVALLVTRRKPALDHEIEHLTFRRTVSVQERLGFELDHYDQHMVPQALAEAHDWIWRANLLGGGRLQSLTMRVSKMRTLKEFVASKGWDGGEGFIVGNKRHRVPWLTGKPYLPATALNEEGINRDEIGKVEETHFEASRTENRFTAPLIIIRELGSLPCDFVAKGMLTFGHQIVSFHAPLRAAAKLRAFYNEFRSNRAALQAFCALLGSRAMTGKATSILKRDIDILPWPQDGESWRLSFWEKVLCEDIVEHIAEFVRRGQNSALLRSAVESHDLVKYTGLFVRLLGSVYDNLRVAKSLHFDGLVCQAFCFGDAPEVEWPEDWSAPLKKLVYARHGEALRTVRVLRVYERNTILVVKPDRLRYWIRSTAIRDADETLADLRRQGY